MIEKRKAVAFVGFFVLAFLGWLTGVMIYSPIHVTTQVQESPVMIQLRHDLVDFIVERFHKEKPTSELVNISVSYPIDDISGMLKAPYTLTYSNRRDRTTSVVTATALLIKKSDQWKVERVLTEKEVVNFDTASVVATKTRDVIISK